MKNLSRILQRLRPGAHYVIRGEEYEGIEWYDAIQTQPTLAEVEAAAPLEDAVDARMALDKQELQAKRIDSSVINLLNASPANLLNYAKTTFTSLTLDEQQQMALILSILQVAARASLR